MYSTSLTASFCVCLPSTLTYALLLLLLSLSLSLLLLLLLCVFGKESRHQAKFVCLFDFGYSGGFGFGFGQEAATAVHASSRLGLTIIVNLAYGFFIVASVSLPPSSSRSSWPQIIFTANTVTWQPQSVSQSLCGLRTECNQIKLHKLLFNYYWHWPSCPAAQLPGCPVVIPIPIPVDLYTVHGHTDNHNRLRLLQVPSGSHNIFKTNTQPYDFMWYMWVWWDLVKSGLAYHMS